MKKLILNTMASFTNELVTIIMGFVLPRLILVYYGSDVNGLVTSITQFLSFVSLCEMGIGPVIKANLYRPLADNDVYSTSCVMKSAKYFFRKIALILVIYTVVLSVVYPSLVADKFDFIFTATMILIISISLFAQYYFGITYQLLLAANQQAYIQLFINCIALTLNTIACVILMRIGSPIHLVKLTTSVLFAARPVCLAIYVKTHFKLESNVEYTDEPIKQKWNGFAQHVATMVQDNTDTVILTLFSTLSDVSIYGIYHLVVNGVRQLVNTVFTGMSSLIGMQIAKGNQEKLNNTFTIFEWSVHSATTILFSITGLLLLPFVNLYTQGITDADYLVPTFGVLVTLCGALRCIQMIYIIVIQGAGHFKQTQVASFLEPIINIFISVIAVLRYGLIGVAVGTFISLTYRFGYMVLYLKKHILYRPIKIVLKQVCVDILCVALIVFATYFVPKYADNYLTWIINAIINSVISIVSVIFVNLIFYRYYMDVLLRKIFSNKERS